MITISSLLVSLVEEVDDLPLLDIVESMDNSKIFLLRYDVIVSHKHVKVQFLGFGMLSVEEKLEPHILIKIYWFAITNNVLQPCLSKLKTH